MPHVRTAFVLMALLSTGAGAQRLPVIDVHLHAYPTLPPPGDPIWTAVPPGLNRSRPATPEEHRAETLRQMDRHNVVLGVLSGPSTELLRSWKAESPGRFIAGAWLKVDAEVRPSVNDLRSAFEDETYGVLGELNLAYDGVSPDDPRLDPYYAMAAKLGVPVGFHMSLGPPGTPYYHAPRFRITLGDPALLEPVLIRHPMLKVYLMHAGHPFLDHTKAILFMYPQVYLDVGVISWVMPRAEFHNYLRALIDAGFEDRIMFGSDQVFWPEAIGIALDAIGTASFLTERQRRGILYDNAARFLELSDREIARHHSR